MKKVVLGIMLLSSLGAVAYGKENPKVVQEISKEKKAQIKEGKKVIKEIREDLNESLELKVFRSENTPEARQEAAEKAFETGDDRLAFLRAEEEEIDRYKKEGKMEDGRKLLDAKFQETYTQFKENQEKMKSLQAENEKLKAMMNKLETMENNLK